MGRGARYREEMQSVRTHEEAAAARLKLPKPTLQKLVKKDDIENFLSMFERIAKQQARLAQGSVGYPTCRPPDRKGVGSLCCYGEH